jgi:predicted O-linked N-acetylglucosamine transferase (SPINDLY family)
LGSITEALECFRSVLEGQPQDRSALAGSASCAFRLCDWDLADSAVKQLIEIPDGIDDLHPFLRLALDIEPAALAASFARESQAIAARAPEVPVPAFSHDRLRIAYLSPDFRRHPVAYALAGVIRHHDRQIFETIGVSLTAPDDSDIAVELRSSFEKFLDFAAMSDADIVRALRAREIDIAVDLAGFTSGSRPAIFAARIAPVQVNYLGFPGSTGARYMDFIIADDVVAPAADARLSSERIVRLPRSYLPFDRDRSIAIAPARRRDYGLPDDAVVLCAFTNGYKISRAVFELWLSLLGAVPDSVLWLRSGPAAMQANLLSAATKHGVGADRLVFSPFVARMDEHLARLQLADLFLDTLPYGAHTTTAEALWAGLPVITCRGRTFAGRVGASLLSAAGLPDLITESLDEYRDRALRLAVSPGARAELRERVHASRKIAAAFDTVGYARDLESALGRLCREH